MNPIWLLDVDGVLNALSHRNGLVKTTVMGFPIRWSPEVIAKVSELSERVEVHWCTTWSWDAADKLAPVLGLPSFPVDAMPIPGKSNLSWEEDWWKFHVFKDYVRAGREVIWTDDDIPSLTLREYKDHETALVIRPNTRTGLTQHDLQKIEGWLNEREPASS